MKKILLSVLLFIGTTCTAQVGIITITEDDLIPLNQWYVVSGDEKWNSNMFYASTVKETKEVLSKILDDFDLKFKDGELDIDGNLNWYLDNSNGYYSTVIYWMDLDGTANLTIFCYEPETTDFEEVEK